MLKGENLMLFFKEGDLLGNASTRLIPLAMATTCQIQLTTNSFSATSKDSGSWEASLPGTKGWQVTSENLYTPHWDKLFNVWTNRTTIPVYWCPSANTESGNTVTHEASLNPDNETYKLYFGDAWISNLQGTANNNEAANVSITLQGTGPITQDNKIPTQGIGVSQDVISMMQGQTKKVNVIGATGTLTASTSNANIRCTFANGLATIEADPDTAEGAYIVTISDSGTGTSTYVFVTVTLRV